MDGWRSDRGFAHDFSTEPRVRGLEENSPAWGKLQEGDILVAVDGVLITTREGGRRLANLTPNRPVKLRVRRGGQEMDVAVVMVRKRGLRERLTGLIRPRMRTVAESSAPWSEQDPDAADFAGDSL